MADDPNGWKLFQSCAAYQPDPVQSTALPDSNSGLVGTSEPGKAAHPLAQLPSYCVVIESFPGAAAELHQQLEGSFPQETILSVFQRDATFDAPPSLGYLFCNARFLSAG
jgi:hypothetical protein